MHVDCRCRFMFFFLAIWNWISHFFFIRFSQTFHLKWYICESFPSLMEIFICLSFKVSCSQTWSVTDWLVWSFKIYICRVFLWLFYPSILIVKGKWISNHNTHWFEYCSSYSHLFFVLASWFDRIWITKLKREKFKYRFQF